MKDKFFIDSNVCLYLLSNDIRKREIAKDILLLTSFISTQVISENINVIHKKLKHLTNTDINGHIELIIKNTTVEVIKIVTLKKALFIKERYQLQWYDSLIIAAALQAGCTTLYSEDMQHGLVVDEKLTIINPFL